MKTVNINLFLIALITQLIFSHQALAAIMGPDDWKKKGDIDSFLNSEIFNESTQLSSLDFTGQWLYTAIARESGNLNQIDHAIAPGENSADTSVTFHTNDYSNWGSWITVDFDTMNLFFEDSNGPWNIALDPFTSTQATGFKIFQLTANADINYLNGNTPLSLSAGDIIVGFNDNHAKNSDGDYDDIIVAMRAVAVPAPAGLMLLGLVWGCLMFARRKYE